MEHKNDRILHCVRCGQCCKLAGGLVPSMARSPEDSICRFFKEPNVCTVYERRPKQCRAAELDTAVVIRQKEVCEYLQGTDNPDFQKAMEILK